LAAQKQQQMGTKESKEKRKEGKDKSGSSSKAEKTEEINSFSKITHFSDVEVGNLYKVFKEISQPSLKVNHEVFQKCLAGLEQYGFVPPNDPLFSAKLFDLFDTNRDGVVDLQEFVCGLSILCKGTAEEKLQLSFKSYDINNDGFISREEMFSLFKSAWLSGFKTLSLQHGGDDILPEQLDEFSSTMAKNFATSAFEALDTDHNGKLTIDEFTKFALASPKITATLNGFKCEVNLVLYFC